MFLEENHFPSLNCYSQLSWEIRELNKILLMVQRPATFLAPTGAQGVKMSVCVSVTFSKRDSENEF